LSTFSLAQVSIGTLTPDTSAVFELTASSENPKGLLLPRMTTVQRNAIVNPSLGLIIYNTTLKCLETYHGLRWICEIPRSPTDVYNPTTGQIWMDRNLGASQVATSSTDHLAYGSIFQWGRGADGHQLITWTSSSAGTAVNSTVNGPYDSDTPSTVHFIKAANPPYDWRTNQNNNLWQGVNGINNPCPYGYRIPTKAEWEAEMGTWSSNNTAGAFASSLKLPLAGLRTRADGDITYPGVEGYYWSSTVSETNSFTLILKSSEANMSVTIRARGSSVRCIKD